MSPSSASNLDSSALDPGEKDRVWVPLLFPCRVWSWELVLLRLATIIELLCISVDPKGSLKECLLSTCPKYRGEVGSDQSFRTFCTP